MTTTRRGRLGRWLLPVPIALQLLLIRSTVIDVSQLIDYDALIVPRLLNAPMIAAVCYAVALAACFGRTSQLAWRMYAIMAAQTMAALALIWGGAGGGFALA